MSKQAKIPLTMWMSVPSFYQADLLRALVATGDVDLQVIFSRRLSPDRIALGWQDDTTGYSHLILNNDKALAQAFRLAWAYRKRIHIVNGIWSEPTIMAVVAALRLAGARYLNYSEAPNPLLARSALKVWVKYNWGRWVAQSHTGLLAISRMSSDYYTKLGFPPRYIYEFGYFMDSYKGSSALPNPNAIELVYIGQLIERKGIDLLLNVLLELMPSYPNLSLTLIGDGSEREQYTAMASSHLDRIHFIGVLPSDRFDSG